MKSFNSLVFASLTLIIFIIGCSDDYLTPTESESMPKNKGGILHKTIVSDFAGLPYWARTGFFPRSLNGYSPIYFYIQDPNVVPSDFNLLDFWDYRTYTINPEWAVDGFENYHNDDIIPVPRIVHLKGKGAVPFYLIPEGQAIAVFNNGSLTVAELEALNPIKGYATHFIEELHPLNHPQWRLKTEAKGFLEGGGSFHVNISWNFDLVSEDKVNGVIKITRLSD